MSSAHHILFSLSPSRLLSSSLPSPLIFSSLVYPHPLCCPFHLLLSLLRSLNLQSDPSVSEAPLSVETDGRSYWRTGSLSWLEWNRRNGVKCYCHMFDVFDTLPFISFQPLQWASPPIAPPTSLLWPIWYSFRGKTSAVTSFIACGCELPWYIFSERMNTKTIDEEWR